MRLKDQPLNHKTLPLTHLMAIAILLFTSCAKKEGDSHGQAAASPGKALELPLPVVPDSIRAPSQRAAYILRHFWDEMRWENDSLVGHADFMEQNSANFFNVIPATDSLSAVNAVSDLLERASVNPKACLALDTIAEKYLWEPNSPMLSEESYLIFTDAQLLHPERLDEARLERIKYMREVMLKNRVNTPATDFEYITREGERRRLSDDFNTGANLMVIFFDPECENCKTVEKSISEDPHITAAQLDGSLKVIAVSPMEVDGAAWQKEAVSMPTLWTVGYSPGGEIDNKDLYILRATPTVMIVSPGGIILDKDKR